MARRMLLHRQFDESSLWLNEGRLKFTPGTFTLFLPFTVPSLVAMQMNASPDFSKLQIQYHHHRSVSYRLAPKLIYKFVVIHINAIRSGAF